jgi:hypothetical protein
MPNKLQFHGNEENAQWMDWKGFRDGVKVVIKKKPCSKIGI